MAEEKNKAGAEPDPIDIFNFSGSDVNAFNEDDSDKVEILNPKPQGKEEYILTLRILPNHRDPKNSITHKTYYWLEDGKGRGFIFDTPQNVKEFCPVTRTYWELHEDTTKDARMNALGKELRWQKKPGCVVQVKSDNKTPDNVGKILLYRLPVMLYKFIMESTILSPDSLKAGKKPKEFLNPFSAYDIILTIKNGTDGRTYTVDLSESKTSIMIDGKDDLASNDANKKLIMDLLESNEYEAIKHFGYKPADDKLKQRVKYLLCSRYNAVNDFWDDIKLENPHAHPSLQNKNAIQVDPNPIIGDVGANEKPTAPAVPNEEETPAENKAGAQSETPTENNAKAEADGEAAGISDIDAIVQEFNK